LEQEILVIDFNEIQQIVGLLQKIEAMSFSSQAVHNSAAGGKYNPSKRGFY